MFRSKKESTTVPAAPGASVERLRLALRAHQSTPAHGAPGGMPTDGLLLAEAEDAETIASQVSSRVEASRTKLAGLIADWRASSDADVRRRLLIKIRTHQDGLGTIRQRNLSLFGYASPLSWVDSWSPDV